jgi:predicted methyltransferase
VGEVPLLKQLRERHEAEGLSLLGISVDESAEALDRMVASKSIPWPQLWDAKAGEAEIPKLFVVDGTPLLYLIDRGGRVAGRFRSVAEVERELPEVLASSASLPRSPRDQWQRPNALMDRLGIKGGAVVADVGAGEGYFSRHLAARVGTEGKVYAVDVDEKALASLQASARAQGLSQVETVRGTADDPRLPASTVDVALIVDAYHEFTAPEAMLRRLHAALRPGGRLGLVEASDALGRPRKEYEERHRLPPEILIEEAARHGFRLKSFEPDFVPRPSGGGQYLVVFQKPE